MRIYIITLFPDMFTAVSEQGVVSRLIKSGTLQLSFINPRDFTTDVHNTVDDRPYGGGPGMVMMVEPLLKAIESAQEQIKTQHKEQTRTSKVVYFSPVGDLFKHATAKQSAEELQQGQDLILLCGRYEGVDQRLLDNYVDEQWSLGDFVLSGGEIPALAAIDAIARLIPGCLGNKDSVFEDSFVEGLLDYGHYTRPENFAGLQVPDVLLSGNHKLIRQWRQRQSLKLTLEKRPDLLESAELEPELETVLKELKNTAK